MSCMHGMSALGVPRAQREEQDRAEIGALFPRAVSDGGAS